ncbi:hypothetical protein [Pseudomonas sp. 3JA]|uniref:hypothetical protein n=1 Tax=Pseudomonas sp. 3JA TaxID=3109347 RepID=UPI00300A9765
MLIDFSSVAPRPVVDSSAGADGLNRSSSISREVLTTSNGPAVLSVGRGSDPSGCPLRLAESVCGTSQINENNAKDVLEYLKGLPKSENTFQARLACLRADPSLETWQALTYISNEELIAQKALGFFEFKEFLGRAGVWLPEIENVNHNIINNLLVRAADECSGSFVELMLGGGEVNASDLVIARGAPAVGKSSYLANRYAVAPDEAKSMIRDRVQGLTNDQVHFQGTTIVQRFEHALMERFSLVFTSDALYLTVDAVENKLNAMVDSGKGQKVSVRDIQVDLVTLCCRVLKRGGNEPRMTFGAVSNFAKSAVLNRQAIIDLLEQKNDLIKDYSLLVWEAGKYIEVARFSPEEGKIVAVDQDLFEKYVTSKYNDNETEAARGAVIDEGFMMSVVEGLEAPEAQRFLTALKVYEGKTLEEAMHIHSRSLSADPTIGSRVLKGLF